MVFAFYFHCYKGSKNAAAKTLQSTMDT